MINESVKCCGIEPFYCGEEFLDKFSVRNKVLIKLFEGFLWLPRLHVSGSILVCADELSWARALFFFPNVDSNLSMAHIVKCSLHDSLAHFPTSMGSHTWK